MQLKWILAALAATSLFAGCDSNDGPLEEAGEELDQAGDDVEGAAEDLEDDVEEAAEETTG